MPGIIYDLTGTILLNEPQIYGFYRARAGFWKMLERQKKLKWKLALFTDEERELAHPLLAQAGLEKAFAETHFGELDADGLKELPKAKLKNAIFIGDMPRDLRAAEKYKINFVKLPPFSLIEDTFNLLKVQELLEAVSKGAAALGRFATKHKIKKYERDKKHIVRDYIGEHLRIRLYPKRFEASFF